MRVVRLIGNLIAALLMPLLVACVGWYLCSLEYFSKAAEEWNE